MSNQKFYKASKEVVKATVNKADKKGLKLDPAFLILVVFVIVFTQSLHNVNIKQLDINYLKCESCHYNILIKEIEARSD